MSPMEIIRIGSDQDRTPRFVEIHQEICDNSITRIAEPKPEPLTVVPNRRDRRRKKNKK